MTAQDWFGVGVRLCAFWPLTLSFQNLKAMSSILRMNRSIVKRTTLDQQGKDVGVPDATPADRMLMVWPLTLMAWEFKEPNVVQPRLQRHVVRIVRGRN